MARGLTARFFEGSQGRIVTLLQAGGKTADELARALDLTPSAVRVHLSALERDELVRVEGRRPSGRKPALVYGLTAHAGVLLSRAYVPVLLALLDTLGDRMTVAERGTVMREVGRRLAATLPRVSGSRRDRIEGAVRALEQLGGQASVSVRGRTTVLEGAACPLAEVVRSHPEACRVVETVVAELTGEPVREECARGDRPRCSFIVG
jgi:predicted ArsR family transcriptional regulator